jgi:hypothetical protein
LLCACRSAAAQKEAMRAKIARRDMARDICMRLRYGGGRAERREQNAAARKRDAVMMPSRFFAHFRHAA